MPIAAPLRCSRFGNITVWHENYRVDRADFVRRKASGDQGGAPSLEDIGQERQMEFNDDLRLAAPNAEVLNGERARFEIAGGNFRMIVAFDFGRGIALVKFIGTHAEYDRVDALTISLF
jgi:mRNA-degrading endonuclease HigB of HigAB toxin-antitoxin module